MRGTWLGFGLVATLVVVSDGVARGDEPTKPTAAASEANPAVPAAGHSIHGEAFDDGPRSAAVLMPGMGKVDFRVTTKKPDAQAFVNQGVAQLHSFFYLEAERSFRQAAKIDPECGMAYWGMAMANVNNTKRAKELVKEARKRAAGFTRRETLYLEALEALYKEAGTDGTRKYQHLGGWEALVHEFPDDLDAQAWLAMITWQNGTIGSRKVVDMLLQSVMKAEPMHPGAHHYRIHLWDGSKPAWAEKSAELYGKTAPGIAHAWHMPGHTYTSLQKYADAAYQQEASARTDHAYMIRERVMPFEIHNYSHNNQWLVTSLSHVGRVNDALAVARNLVEQARDPNKNGKNDGGSPQRNGRLRWAEALTRYELWDDLIAATESGALDWSDIPAEKKEKAYTLGLAYAAKGDEAKLGVQIEALKALAAGDAKTPKTTIGDSALAELEGHQLLLKGDVGTAFERFGKANAMRPEAVSRAHMKARNFGFAASTAKAAVEKQPGQVAPLAAQVEILYAVEKPKEAGEALEKLKVLAKGADEDLPVFRRIAQVSGWKPEGYQGETKESGRAALATLGPLGWSPSKAEEIARADTTGKTWSLAEHKGRNVVALFYLGGKCAHCMQQLDLFGKQFEALKAAGTDVVAIGTDDEVATKALKENADKVKFPMPMLADPGLELFRKYRAYDDFEGAPLHGTFLIDGAGDVRFQRVSAEPFLDVDFVKAEAERVGRLIRPSGAVTAGH